MDRTLRARLPERLKAAEAVCVAAERAERWWVAGESRARLREALAEWRKLRGEETKR